MRAKIGFSTALNGLSAIGPQVIALLVLESKDFGLFSAVYLLFALGVAVVLSILCDPWTMVYREKNGEKANYTSILIIFSVIFGLLAGAVSFLLIQNIVISLWAFLCICFAVYRNGARYYLVNHKKWNRVFYADLTSFLSLLAGVLVFFGLNEVGLYLVFGAWLFSSIGASVFGPSINNFSVFRLKWVAHKWNTVKPLLIDSLIMEVSSVGTPYILLPVLGLQGFGVYRAVSNLSAPIRLLLSPLRPMIVSSPRALLIPRRLIQVFFMALCISLMAWGVLFLLNRCGVEIGVLTEISSFSVPAGMYLFGAVFLSLYSLVVRAQDDARKLLVGRVVQTVLGILLPIIGYIMSGLSGALWLFAISTLISGLFWLVLAVTPRKIPGRNGL